jgi:hypothetical protein
MSIFQHHIVSESNCLHGSDIQHHILDKRGKDQVLNSLFSKMKYMYQRDKDLVARRPLNNIDLLGSRYIVNDQINQSQMNKSQLDMDGLQRMQSLVDSSIQGRIYQKYLPLSHDRKTQLGILNIEKHQIAQNYSSRYPEGKEFLLPRKLQ